MDIKRICETPTEEDKEWMPQLIGKDWRKEILYAATNFRDDSFVAQYLSPKVIRDMKLFAVRDNDEEKDLEISGIHDETGYKKVIESLSNQYNRERYIPDIQISDVAINDDRSMILTHYIRNGIILDTESAENVVHYVYKLWEFPVYLVSRDESGYVSEIYEID